MEQVDLPSKTGLYRNRGIFSQVMDFDQSTRFFPGTVPPARAPARSAGLAKWGIPKSVQPRDLTVLEGKPSIYIPE